MQPLETIDDMILIPRIKEIQKAENLIQRGEYSLVTAPPKLGKTTFLQMLERRLNEEYPGMPCIYLDLAGKKNVVEQFPKLIAPGLQRAVLTESTQDDDEQCARIGRCFLCKNGAVHWLNQRTVILLDSFDQIPLEEQKELLRNVRDVHVKSHDCEKLNNLVFFIAGAISLYELDPERVSPLHVTNDILLSDFTREETIEFVHQVLWTHRIIPQNAAELYLYDVTAGHPYLLAALCRIIITRMPSGGTPSFSTIQMAVADVTRDRLFHQLRENLLNADSSTIELLKRILSGSLVRMSLDLSLQKLIYPLGIVSPGDDFVKIHNSIFERFLRTDTQIQNNIFKGTVAPMSQIALPTPGVNMRGFELLSQIESALRNFVACKMFAEYGDDWTTKVIPSGILGELNKRRNEEDEEQRSPLLCYTLLNELRAIIEAAWEPVFKTYFGTKEQLNVFFRSLNLIRRKIAHNRNLSDTELSQFEAINQYFYEFMARRRMS